MRTSSDAEIVVPVGRVDVVQAARDDLRDSARLFVDTSHARIPVETVAEKVARRPLAPATRRSFTSQVIRFAAVGGASTIAYALLFLMLQPLFGGQSANILSLLLTTLGSTWAHRWVTFGVTGSLGAIRHQVQGLAVFGLAWGITAGSLLALHVIDPHAGPVTDMVVLVAANLVEGVVRFFLLRCWVFRARRIAPTAAGAVAEPARSGVRRLSPPPRSPLGAVG
jgi:putative flippase GtrA